MAQNKSDLHFCQKQWKHSIPHLSDHLCCLSVSTSQWWDCSGFGLSFFPETPWPFLKRDVTIFLLFLSLLLLSNLIFPNLYIHSKLLFWL
jgi:hypothetical protein